MRNLAIIPARSGSKGLPDKNIKLLAGRPLIAYSIEAAKSSGLFDTVHVSTDSQHYSDIAAALGADEPFLRSARAASDTASSWDAVREVLERYREMGREFDTFMLLQPTSPLRTAEDIKAAYSQMAIKKANAIVSLCEVDHSPLQCNTLPPDQSLASFIPDSAKNKRRQDLGVYYRFNGSIYLSRVDSFMATGDIYADRCYGYIMDKQSSVDIDDLFDFKLAEALLALRNS